MDALTLFVLRDSLIHKLDPLTKIVYIDISIAAAYLLDGLLEVLLVVFVSMGLLLLGKVFRNILPVIALSFLLILSLVIVQGFFNPANETLLYEMGPIKFYKEGLTIAVRLAMRVINMVCAFGVLVLTTSPTELVERLQQKGMSPKIGYVILSVLQIIPQLRATYNKIQDAQRSRGMETEGNMIVRVKAFFPLLGPVILNALNDTRERSIALDVRGFDRNTPKSYLNEARNYPHSALVNSVLVLILVGLIIWRVMG